VSPSHPIEVWRQLVDEAGEAPTDAAGMSVVRAETELVYAGFDIVTERARAAGLIAQLDQGRTQLLR
jgi:hypothetical protein